MSKNLKTGLVVLAAIAVVALWFLLPIKQWIDALEQWITGLGAVGVVAFVVIYIIATVVLAPASALTLLAGLAYGPWGFPLVVGSATLGASAAFLIGRHLAHERVQTRVDDNRTFKAVNQAVGEEGWKIVGLLRLSPVFPFGLQNYFFGVSSIGFWPYAIATFFGIMPGTVLYVYLGTIGKASGGGPAQWALLGAGLVATVAGVWLVTNRAKKALDDMDIEPDAQAEPAE